MPKDIGTEFVAAVVGFESEMVVGFDRVVAGVLKLIGQQLVYEANATSFLKLINQDAGTAFGNFAQGEVKLIAAITPAGTEHISGQALRMDAHKYSLYRLNIAFDQCDHTFRFIGKLETEQP